MLDIDELINDLSVSVEQIIVNDWDLKRINSNKTSPEYTDLVPIITIAIIKNFKEEGLKQVLFNIEKETIGVTPNIERCVQVAKKLIAARNSHHAKLIYKGRRERRENMNKAINEIVIPFLRKKGFKGSFPNFKLEKESQLINLKFQFSQFSSQFVVEVDIPKSGKGNLRLGSIKHQRDYWYDFEKKIDGVSNIYNCRAREILDNWEEAENWIYK